MTTARTRFAIAAACALALVGAAQADAAGSVVQTGVLSMTPARRTVVARPPVRLSSTLVKNTTKFVMDVKVFPALLIQQLDGSFTFNEDVREFNEARLQFNTAPSRFLLKPQQQQKISLRWALLPRRAKAAYLGLVIQGTPRAPGGKGVGSILRLLGVNFFQLPGRWKLTGTITSVRGEQAGRRVLRFLPRVKNTGQIHGQPRASRCRIVDANGRVRLRAPFGPGVVLPGFEREYPILVKKPLEAGRYTITCRMRFGERSSSKSQPFTLVGVNTLPTAALKLVSLGANGEIGGPATLKVRFTNAGTKPSPAVLKASVQFLPPGQQARLAGSGKFAQGVLKPHETRDVTLHLAHLHAGNYRGDVILTDGTAPVGELTSDFGAAPHRGGASRFWNWIKDHLPWLALLIALGVIIFLILLLRRRDEDEDEDGGIGAPVPAAASEAPPRAPVAAPAPASPPRRPTPSPPPVPVPVSEPVAPPAPAAPPAPVAATDGRINVNTASVVDLVQLPGVGRRAAERIVEHREANGPFGSLQDLHAVEGFHDERIQRISGVAEV